MLKKQHNDAMIKFKYIYSALLIVFLQMSCNFSVGYKNPQQVSKSIAEARKNKVFVKELVISNVEILDRTIAFPFNEVWEEKYWNLILDKAGNEISKIDDSSSCLIVFRLNNRDSFLTMENFTAGKWIMWDKSIQSIGAVSDMLNMSVPKDFNGTLLLTVYKKKEANDSKNNLTPLVKFNLNISK